MAYADPTTGLDVLVKQPGENRLYDIPFEQELRAADSIASVASVTVEAQGDVAEISALTKEGAAAHNTDTVQQRLSGGTDGERYKIEAVAITTAGDTIEVDVMLYVRD